MRSFFLPLCLLLASCGDDSGSVNNGAAAGSAPAPSPPQSPRSPITTSTATMVGTSTGTTTDTATTPSSPASIPVPGLHRTFQAGFEAPVTISALNNGQEAKLSGIDSSGYSWSNLDHVFEFVAPNSYQNLVHLDFSSSKAHSGGRSLHLKQDQAVNGTQNRLQFFGDDNVFGTEIYTSRYYYVPSSNLATLSAEESSVSIAGTREERGGSAAPGTAQADFSMPTYLVRKGAKLVFAQAIVDYSAGPNWSDWTRAPKGLMSYGNNTPCPLDRWFKLEIYIKRDPVAGAIKIWLDGQLIFNLQNVRTKNDYPKWLTKLADIDSEPAPFELYVDDVEIWGK